MQDILVGLNENQKKAVLHTEGPILILAGAGSGKTKVLTHRIAYLIYEKKIEPENILAVTFTNKAAKEMRERVEKLLIGEIHLPYLGTFHSICAKILRGEIHNLVQGFNSNFAIFDEEDQKKIIKEIIEELGFDIKQFVPEIVLGTISSAKNELINADSYADYANSYFQEIVAQIFPIYQDTLRKNNAMDFDDLLNKTVELFDKEPKILAKYQKIFRYILVDEYQDTNKSQYKIVNLLASKNRNLCVVGDDWQSIYSWRGADFRNILSFEKDYPDAEIIKLEQNYRSTQNILGAAQKIIEKNQNRSDKELWTENPKGEKILVYSAYSEKDEAEFVVNRIIDYLQKDKDLKLSDFSVFYRTNAQSRILEEAFLRYGLAYQIVGGVRFYERQEIKDILAYLKILQNPLDKISLKRILNIPPRGIGGVSAKKIIQNWNKVLAKDFDKLNLSPKTAVALEVFWENVSKLKKFVKGHSIAETIDEIINIMGYRDYLLQKFPNKVNSDISEGEIRLENIQELKSVALNFSNGEPEHDLMIFLGEVALMSDIDSLKDQHNAVTLMTLHNAKGLEFPIVFMVGMEENLFPHSRTLLEPGQIEEERRLCYVGITRARQALYCIYCKSRVLYGGVQYNLPSRFLADIPEEYLQEFNYANLNYNPNFGLKSLTKNSEKFNVGDKVVHEIFGQGIVVSNEADIVTIAFVDKGIKKLDPSIAPIKKLGK